MATGIVPTIMSNEGTQLDDSDEGGPLIRMLRIDQIHEFSGER
jgi:hypothetical protein